MPSAANAVPASAPQQLWYVDVFGDDDGMETCGPVDYERAQEYRDVMLPWRCVREIHLRQAGVASRVERTTKIRRDPSIPAECR